VVSIVVDMVFSKGEKKRKKVYGVNQFHEQKDTNLPGDQNFMLGRIDEEMP